MSGDSTLKQVTLIGEVRHDDWGQKLRIKTPVTVNGTTEIEFVLPYDAVVEELPWPDWPVGTVVETNGEAYVVMLLSSPYNSADVQKNMVRVDRSKNLALVSAPPTISEFIKENTTYTVLFDPERELA